VTPALRILAVLLAACAGQAANAQLFKCVQKDGKVHYQDQKCADEAKETTLQAPPPAPPPPVDPATPAGKAKVASEKNRAADIDAVIDVVSSYEACAQEFPTFASKFGAGYESFKQRNLIAMTQYQQDPEAVAKVQKRIADQKKELKGEAALQRCDKVIGPMMSRAGPGR
jgi:uncharacterized protein DUF4124